MARGGRRSAAAAGGEAVEGSRSSSSQLNGRDFNGHVRGERSYAPTPAARSAQRRCRRQNRRRRPPAGTPPAPAPPLPAFPSTFTVVDLMFDLQGEPSCSEDCSTSDEVSVPMTFEYEIWANEPMSVQERRQKFLKGMGFDDFVSARTDSFQCHGEITAVESSTDMEERSVSGHSSVGTSVCDNESEFDSACCIRDMDSGKKYIVHNGAHSSITDMLKEVGSDKVMSLLEFESLLGLSRIPTRTRVQHRKKKFLEFSAVYMDQEIRAHKGSIRVMKFSPSGWYLASGGEDCVVRIWQIIEVEASPKLYRGEDPCEKVEKVQVINTNIEKGQNQGLAVIPKKVFRISETPLHEFRGHTSDILDMAWSKSDFSNTETMGFIVGTIAGACRFYDQSGENIQLEKELFVQGKKKSAASRINSLQLCTIDSTGIIITSGGSKIRVANGDTIQKFEGPWKSKALSSPSLTSDGRYLISAGKDSNVYIWNFANSGDAKSVHSCELFFSKDVTTAVPWPGVHQDGHTKPSCLNEKSSSAPILHHHEECQSPGPWSFVDSSKGSATWPEEKLPSTAKPESSPQLGDCLSLISAAWSTVIVTASRDGVIRSFPNYGLPVRFIQANLEQCWAWCFKWLPQGQKAHVWSVAAVCWAIWKARNKARFKKKLIKNPIEIVCHACALMKYWTCLFVEMDRKTLEEGVNMTLKVAMDILATNRGNKQEVAGRTEDPEDDGTRKN
ncbi:unnamed protein product [Miscanthus lutarioriparius]|uniref:Uncharacterized protein n=1 Tax=Miscanthus lutarioriparius TaxID=422564 RepID=A0A811QR49_9POAL|nr:unnamed protein product [Miscanthus lutarioriparius]